MIKKFCDCCNKELTSNRSFMPIEVPCHHYSAKGNVSGGYVDSELNYVSGRYDKIDLCASCSNQIFSAAIQKFDELKKSN